MQIKTTIRNHFTPIRKATIKTLLVSETIRQLEIPWWDEQKASDLSPDPKSHSLETVYSDQTRDINYNPRQLKLP